MLEAPCSHLVRDPADRELGITSGKLVSGDLFGLEKYVAPSSRVTERSVGNDREKRAAIHEVTAWAEAIGARRPIVHRLASVIDELLMNALHDAPRESRPVIDPSLGHGMKRGLDIVGSVWLLVALAPLFAVAAGLVKCTSPGPVFFKQARVGRRGEPFTMFKFRTMRADAGHAVHQDYVAWFIESSGKQPRSGHEVFKLTNDPRVTRVGHFLRRTSLDELPQFWNVLRGEMSLVGPRPPLPFEVERYRPWHRRRVLEVKPGITGLWQVSGRSRTTFDDMVRLDLRYARTWSLWTDIKILAATPWAVISGKGACWWTTSTPLPLT